ncbi:hypothetical protein [Xanthomarina gelatinilytica]|uniref:hypothetical protein n=1 Tax=Xanthomarina gelatinilytica TaxID=1137281 RepID=UPI003AA9292D
MNKSKIILLFYLTLIEINIMGQTSQTNSKLQIEIGKNILLNEVSNNEQFIEPHITSHPSNPNHLLAVSAVFPAPYKSIDPNDVRSVSFVSNDGGLTWSRHKFSAIGGLDAWVTLTDNIAVTTILGKHSVFSDYKFNSPNSQLLCYFSFDGGYTWSKTPQSMGQYHDGPRSSATKDGSIFIASHQSFSRENTRIYVARILQDAFLERTTFINPSNLNIAVDGITTYSDGTLAIAYQDFQRPITGAMRDKKGNWRGRLKTRREWLVTSKDKGITFSAPKLISEEFYDRANDLSVDNSDSKYKNRIYCVGSNTNYKSILLTYSDDYGNTWSDITFIEPSNLEGVRKEPHIAINKDGTVAIAWFDSRDNPEKRLCYSPYITFSMDGGKTFSKPVKVANEKSCLDPSLSGKAIANRFPEGGDYFGLNASADGKFHILWPDARTGKFDLYTSAITLKYN